MKKKKKRGLRHQESTVHIVILLPKGPRQFGYESQFTGNVRGFSFFRAMNTQ